MVPTDVAQRLIREKSWHHEFEIVPGVRTQGAYNPSGIWEELALPSDMSGLSLADVGASSGFFSFEARKRGARVVAFDVRHRDNSGFGLAQHINGLTDIEHHHVNVLDLRPGDYGRFDVVLAMGLLYHTPDPYRALATCAAMSSDRLIVECYCIDALLPPAVAAEPLMRFIADTRRFPGQGQPNADRSNFWGFTSTCLHQMIEDIGFGVQRSAVRGDRVLIDARHTGADPKATRLPIGYGLGPHVPAAEDRDDPGAWTLF
ncbi:MAG TPA: methyltransferase domain-containing protein [Vicinamibacterales bacterium]